MKHIFLNLRNTLVIIGLFIFSFGNSQIVTTDPIFPFEDQMVTIVFDATNTPLENVNSTIFTHTGVILQGSSSWSHVVGDWGDNTNQPQLTSLGNNLFSLEIGPSIKAFYEVPSASSIKEMAFVFRSGDGAVQSSDVFVQVYENDLNVVIASPEDQSVYNEGETVSIKINAIDAISLTLYLDEVLIEETSEDVISYDYTAEAGTHWIKAIASNGTDVVKDSASFIIRPELNIAALPNGLVKGINYIDETTVSLVLYAPYKEYIYVLGDFNNWVLNNDYFMNKTPEGDLFWLTIENLNPGQEYIFQYDIDSQIRIADPYSEKISDPWNDHDISNSTYPNLIEYPSGFTNEIASVLQTNQQDYEWQINDFVAPAKEDLIIYELLVRDFTDERNFKTLMDSLDYLENLGVNAIEFMPLNEFEGNESWGYNPAFYFAVDKFYGTKNDFKVLVDECHNRGMAVIFDVVLNHTYGSSPMVRMYFDNGKPAANNPWYNVNHSFLNSDAHWGYDFNHESLATQEFIDSVNSYWMSEYKIDGFRFDFTKGFTNDIKDSSDPWGSNYDASRISLLKRMSDEIWERNSNAYVIFEHLSENSEEKVLADYGIMLWGNLNHNYNEGTMGWVSSGKSDISWGSYQERNWNHPNLITYMESHDEERLMFKNYEYGNSTIADYDLKSEGHAVSRMELASVFLMSIPGPKMIWQFGELAYDVSIDFNGRVGIKPTKWEYFEDWRKKYLYDVYSSMIKLKKEEPAFGSSDFDVDGYGPLKRIKLIHEQGDFVILGNWGVEAGQINPDFPNTGWWYEYFTGDSINVLDVNDEIQLQAGEYRVYSNYKITTPDIMTSINEGNSSNHVLLYPNPSDGNFTLDILSEDENTLSTDIFIYNINGKVLEMNKEELKAGRNKIAYNSNLKQGVYFMQIKNSSFQELKRFIIQ